MATYQFSALADGQAISFNANVDVLNFDQSVIAAADIRVTTEGTSTRITVVDGTHEGKDVLLLNTSMLQFTTGNIRFANGSVLLIGDNSTGTTADNSANTRFGTAGRDQLNGLGGADTLNGGGGDDLYVVSTGDVVNDSSGIDTVYTDVSWTFAIGNRLENLAYIGSAAGATLTGNELNNIITGNDLAQASINGRAGNDTMYGLGGNDNFDMSTGGTASYGNDVIDGGAGVDTIDFGVNARSALNIDLTTGSISGGGDAGAGTVAVSNVENVVGGAFADVMLGNAAANFLFGGDGNDTLNGAAGVDRLEGGLGADEYVFSVAPGAANADTVVGFATGADRIVLDGTFHANLGANGQFASGDERFHTGTAAAEADDRVIYNPANGQLLYDADGLGGAGAVLIATLPGGALAATDIYAINGSSSGSSATGTNGNDSIAGTPGNDTINGLGGHDTLSGMWGNDVVIGGDGNDSLRGGPGSDSLSGGAGNDTLQTDGEDNGSPGDGDVDTLDGGFGDDLYVLDRNVGINTEDQAAISDAGGNDTVLATGGSFALGAGIENLTLEFDWTTDGGTHGIGNELDNVITGVRDAWWVRNHLNGLAGNDTLLGGEARDWLEGGDGNDSLYGGLHADTMDGGAGNDTLDASDGGAEWGEGAQMDGGAGNDVLLGSSASDTLTGGDGDDWLERGVNSEWHSNFSVDFSSDFMSGGAGRDSFVFRQAPEPEAVNINDFASGADKLVFDAEGFAALGRDGNFSVNDERFHIGATAAEADDRIIWDASTGQLWYDPDGNRSSNVHLVADLGVGTTFVATDISVLNGTPAGSNMTGTQGNDSLNGTAGDDTISGLGGDDTLFGAGGGDRLDGGPGNDVVVGGSFDDQSGTGGDLLIGGDGDDKLDGNAGQFIAPDMNVDTLDGGLGNDWYEVDNASDLLIDAGGIDLVRAEDVNWTLGPGFENLILVTDGSEFGTGTGNALNNHMSVTYRGSLFGMGGDDTLIGAGGTLGGGDGNDLIQGNLANFADGGAGNDTISGAFQATGGAGADVFYIDFFDLITDFSTGSDTLLLDAAYSGFANAGLSGRFASDDARFYAAEGATGAHDADDRLIYDVSTGDLYYDRDGTGSSADATVLGRLEGAPALAATDVLVINGQLPGQTINGTEGNDSLVGTVGADTLNGLGGNDSLDGGEGADSLVGGAGSDTLFGGSDGRAHDGAADTLDGGLGDDEYRIWAFEDVIVVPDPGGIDTVYVVGDFTLGGGLDNLHMETGTGTGNELDNEIVGPVDSGLLFGMGGNDTLVLVNGFNSSSAHGGDGDDTLYAARNSHLFGDEGNDVLVGSESAFPNTTMTGGTGSDSFVFISAHPHDITDFLSGTDKIRLDANAMTALGTNGNFAIGDERFHAGPAAAEADDRVVYDAAMGRLFYDRDGSGSAEAQLIATLQPGTNLVATDIAVDNGAAPPPPTSGQMITGTAGNDSLTGTDGNDTLDGLGGNDTLNGGLGDDKYIAQAGDVLQDSGGIDTLETSSSWNLTGTPIDNITVIGTAGGSIVANDLDNRIVGNSAGNSLDGRGGNDFIDAAGGSDRLYGNAGNDTLTGGGGHDSLVGADGDDVLNGGTGYDTLSGGAGADSFVFAESGSANYGQMTDFVSGTDQLLFDNVFFTALGAESDWAAGDGRLRIAAGATSGADANDRLIYNTSNGNLYYDPDGSGAAAGQIVITLNGAPALSAADITVI